MGIFASLFKKKLKRKSDLKFIDLFEPFFSRTYDHDQKLNDTFMSAVQAHARHVSKIKPVVKFGEGLANKPYLTRLLQLRPNSTMNAATFWEKVRYHYDVETNVFIWIERDLYAANPNDVKSLWLINPETAEVRVTDSGKIVIKFLLEGQEIYTGMEDVIHVAKNVNAAEFFGTGNKVIETVLKVINTNYAGIENAIKTSAFLRFVVISTTPISPKVKAERAKEFAETYLSIDKSPGIAYLDSVEQLIQVNNQSKYANFKEMELFDEKIYNYIGINRKIINATYNEDEWQAYYESSLEPFFTKLEQELTYKLFTQREIELGNRIEIEADRLHTASLKTRIGVAQVIQGLPVYRPNDIYKLLYLSPLENGDKEFSNLNYVPADIQEEYQVGKPEKENEEVDDEPEAEKEKQD